MLVYLGIMRLCIYILHLLFIKWKDFSNYRNLILIFFFSLKLFMMSFNLLYNFFFVLLLSHIIKMINTKQDLYIFCLLSLFVFVFRKEIKILNNISTSTSITTKKSKLSDAYADKIFPNVRLWMIETSTKVPCTDMFSKIVSLNQWPSRKI